MSTVCGIWGLIDSEARGSESKRGVEERGEGDRNRKKGRKTVMKRERERVGGRRKEIRE